MPGSTAESLLINTIFSAALEKKASDIHLMSGNYPIFRIGDSLHVLGDQQVLTVELLNALLDMILSDSDKETLKSEKEVRTVYVWANRARFRTSVYYQQGYPAFSFRLVKSELPDPATLGIPESVVERSERRQGLIIVCGPFNSGRTTTVMSLLQHLNHNSSSRLLTLERPIEYQLVNKKSLVNQREVGRDTPSYLHGVKDAIDEDVDVVAVGEISEPGMAEAILTLVESGKLVMCIMNATSAISALEKFLSNISDERRQWAKDSMANLLLAIMSQRLVKGIDGNRMLASGILTMTPAVASVIQDGHYAQLATVMQTSREEGMVTLDVRLQELVRSGKITPAEAKKHAIDSSRVH